MIEAKLDVVNAVQFSFICDRKEFLWLKSLLQNPMYEDETSEEHDMRSKWFEALKKAEDWYIPF